MSHSIAPLLARRGWLIVAASVAAALIVAPRGAFAAEPAKPSIGIVGAGKVGTALGTAWVKAGHKVMFSSTHLDDDKALAASLGANASAGSPREAAAFGDVVVVSVPLVALPAVGKDIGAALQGKVVIDTINAYERRDGQLAVDALAKGVAVSVADALPGARTVRTFNGIPAARMATGLQDSPHLGMPLSGRDAKATATVAALIREIGFEPVTVDWSLANQLRPDTPFGGMKSPDELRDAVKSSGR